MSKVNANYCGISKRIFAFILDIVCAILIAINLNNFVVNPLLSKSFHTDLYEEQYRDRLLESNLYFLGEDGLCYQIDMYADFNKDCTNEEYVSYMEQQLDLFYSNASFDCAQVSYYNALKEAATEVFIYDNSNDIYSYVNGVSIEKKIEFYKSAVAYSIDKVLVNDNVISTIYSNIMTKGLLALGISLFLSLIIFNLIIPLFSKKNYTLGKFMFKIGTVNSITERNARKSQIVLRFIVYSFEVLISFLTFGAVLLVSFAFTLFTKNNSAIHDMIAKTKLIDLTTTKLLTDKDVIEEGELACQ